MFNTIKTKLEFWWAPASIEQLVTSEAEKAQIEIFQRDTTIRRERFARHLALAKLEAVRSWENDKPSSML